MTKTNDQIKEITEKLEKGVQEVFTGDAYAKYLEFVSKFYDYSANNCMLIWLQMPTASLVAGYKAWQTKFNRQVKKGEKAIRILAPCPHKFKKEVEDEDGNKTEKTIEYMIFRATSVFDISQTEGEEIPSVCNMLTGEVENYSELLESLKRVSPVPVSFENIEGGANGYYSYLEKRIALNEGMSEQQTIKTAIHEIAHSILHNKEDGEEMEADKRTKEVQAESVAYTVCNYLGLDTSDYSFGYVAGWSAGKEVKELIASMEVIRKTAKSIIEGLKAA